MLFPKAYSTKALLLNNEKVTAGEGLSSCLSVFSVDFQGKETMTLLPASFLSYPDILPDEDPQGPGTLAHFAISTSRLF